MVPSVYKSEYVLVNGEEIESGKKFKFPANGLESIGIEELQVDSRVPEKRNTCSYTNLFLSISFFSSSSITLIVSTTNGIPLSSVI